MNKTKKVTLGLGLVGVTTGLVISKKMINKLYSVSDRYKIKKVVAKNFDGNEKLLETIDHLSKDELSAVSSIIKKNNL
ncbi:MULTISPECIES: hypothetical protein [unclassified Enterococcus]|uniref:hypothetical protein n=1 Tax=unclassified Enterococcus TaxID=2608891 RepID=UPI0021599425|nr:MULTISPECIES: hypothetical protein [unclassified Enterococcus]